MTSSGNPGRHHPHKVFSAKNASHLDTRLRRFIYRPERLAEQYIKPGDQVLDFGCGPGFFTRAFAKRTGDGGQVFAVDLQEEMLNILRENLGREGLLPQITTHRCTPGAIGLPMDRNGTFDVAFAIFVVHEVPDPARLFGEIFLLLKPGGTLFYSDPPFIVSGREFREYLAMAEAEGLRLVETKLFFVNRAAVLKKK